jgi:protein-tyrosine phosphatase
VSGAAGALPAPSGTPYRIAFVCLGNICRSPMADVILTSLVDAAGLASKVSVSSCGTGGWHVGEPMDPRAATALLAEGYDPSLHRAQQFGPDWLEQDLVLAMDTQNLHDITGGAGGSVHVRMFRSFDPRVGPDATPEEQDVPDPYYGGEEGFAAVVGMVERHLPATADRAGEALARPMSSRGGVGLSFRQALPAWAQEVR